jgi:5-methylcytosine-specific restriction endonuclease McrA
MGKKASRTYFAYPTTSDERKAAFTTFEFAKENNLQRPQYLDDTGNVWRWDNKGNGEHRLINTNTKSARNGRDRARRVGLSLTADDYEQAWPGKGQELYAAEKTRIEEIYASADDSQDVDHIWSLANGGLNTSNNIRPLDSRQNRSEGNRPIPTELEQAAYMMADNKQDQVRLQGPRISSNSTLQLVFNGGKAVLKQVRKHPIEQGVDLFMVGQDADKFNDSVQFMPSVQDIGNGLKEAYTNGKKAIDKNGISTI